jgi:hypothetical protein
MNKSDAKSKRKHIKYFHTPFQSKRSTVQSFDVATEQGVRGSEGSVVRFEILGAVG